MFEERVHCGWWCCRNWLIPSFTWGFCWYYRHKCTWMYFSWDLWFCSNYVPVKISLYFVEFIHDKSMDLWKLWLDHMSLLSTSFLSFSLTHNIFMQLIVTSRYKNIIYHQHFLFCTRTLIQYFPYNWYYWSTLDIFVL